MDWATAGKRGPIPDTNPQSAAGKLAFLGTGAEFDKG
jgi:hypothetical protein